MKNGLKYLLISSLLLLPLISSCGGDAFNSSSKDAFETGNASSGVEYLGKKQNCEAESNWVLPFYDFSDNNSFAFATPLNSWGENFREGTLKLNATLHALNQDHTEIDEDYYVYKVTSPAQFSLTLTSPSLCDYDLEVYCLYPSAKANEQPHLAYASLTSEVDSVTFSTDISLLYIRVFAKNNKSFDEKNPYELSLTFLAEEEGGILPKEEGIAALWKSPFFDPSSYSFERQNCEGSYSLNDNLFTNSLPLGDNSVFGRRDGTLLALSIYDEDYLLGIKDVIFALAAEDYEKEGYLFYDPKTQRSLISLLDVASERNLNIATLSSLISYIIPSSDTKERVKDGIFSVLMSIDSGVQGREVPNCFILTITGEVEGNLMKWTRYNSDDHFLHDEKITSFPSKTWCNGDLSILEENGSLEALFYQ